MDNMKRKVNETNTRTEVIMEEETITLFSIMKAIKELSNRVDQLALDAETRGKSEITMLKTLINTMIANTGQCSVPKKQLNGLEDETTENNTEECIIETDSTSKKLFCTPTPIDRVSKKPKAVSSSKGQSSVSNHKIISPESSDDHFFHQLQPTAQQLYRNAMCRFVPTPNMRLNDQEVQICAYVFEMTKPDGEIIFIHGQDFATREDFEGLCPRRLVNNTMIHLMTLKVTWNQSGTEQAAWCLPPLFAVDALQNKSADQLFQDFQHRWLPPYKKLSLIYIPIQDDIWHWYLMVVSVEQKTIWHFDSYLPCHVTVRFRTITIRAVCKKLMELMPMVYHGMKHPKGIEDFADWKIEKPIGVPIEDNSDNSGVWVMDWMSMENHFVNNLPPVQDVNEVRIRLAMSLLIGKHNEGMKNLLASSSLYWDMLTEKLKDKDDA